MRAISILSVVAFIVGWQLITMSGLMPPYFIASPIEVAQTMWYTSNPATSYEWGISPWPRHLAISLYRVAIGFLLSVAIGVPLGILMGWYGTFEAIVDPIFELLRPIPPIAWIPLAILWFGIGEESKFFIILIGAVIPCLINSYIGIRSTEPVLVKAARTLGAKDRHIFQTIAIPGALPTILGGIRIAAGSSWMCLVAAELIAAQEGLGFLCTHGMRWLRPDIMITGMILIGLMGYLMDRGFRYAEKKFCAWRELPTA